MILPKVIACIPTYREPEKISEILSALKFVRYRPFELFFINACPGDRTSEIIENIKINFDFNIFEISGISSEFWSATVNRGFKKILEIAQQDDWVILMNVDIKFDTDIVDLLIHKALKQGKCQISALSTSNNYVISSGVQVKSWMASLTRHPYAGTDVNNIPKDLLVRVDYLPTRCILFSVEALTKVGLISEKCLPHYGADYEFSHRLAKAGYTPYILSLIHI